MCGSFLTVWNRNSRKGFQSVVCCTWGFSCLVLHTLLLHILLSPLSYSVLSCPILPSPVLYCPIQYSPIFPCPVLFSPILSYPPLLSGCVLFSIRGVVLQRWAGAKHSPMVNRSSSLHEFSKDGSWEAGQLPVWVDVCVSVCLVEVYVSVWVFYVWERERTWERMRENERERKRERVSAASLFWQRETAM